MKCFLTIIVSLVLGMLSSQTFAFNEGIAKEGLEKLHLRTGTARATKVLSSAEMEQYNLRQHKNAFAATLAKIAPQAQKFQSDSAKNSRLLIAKHVLPVDFHHSHVLKLASAVELSPQEDPETRAKKWVRLALLLRDIYDPDNQISRNLLLIESPPSERLTADQIAWLVTESFEQAALLLEKIDNTIPRERAIDFYLSLAQIRLLKLKSKQQSLVHIFTDVSVSENSISFREKTKRDVDAIMTSLKKADELIDDPQIDLPVVYHQALYKMASRLTREQKYELIEMHKKELDEQRDKKTLSAVEELSRARGLSELGKNPLDYFTEERINKVMDAAKRMGISDDGIPRFVDDTMRNYAVHKVKNPADYFNQEVLQRYLLKRGLINRDMLATMIRKKVRALKACAQQFGTASVLHYVSLP